MADDSQSASLFTRSERKTVQEGHGILTFRGSKCLGSIAKLVLINNSLKLAIYKLILKNAEFIKVEEALGILEPGKTKNISLEITQDKAEWKGKILILESCFFPEGSSSHTPESLWSNVARDAVSAITVTIAFEMNEKMSSDELVVYLDDDPTRFAETVQAEAQTYAEEKIEMKKKKERKPSKERKSSKQSAEPKHEQPPPPPVKPAPPPKEVVHHAPPIQASDDSNTYWCVLAWIIGVILGMALGRMNSA